MIERLWVRILAGAAGEFSSPELTLFAVCRLLFSVHSTPVLLQWHKKTLVIVPKVQVAGYTETRIHPLPNQVWMGWLCHRPGIEWLAEPQWTDPCIKSGISLGKLISTSKKRERGKKARAGNEWSNILLAPRILPSEENATTTLV